MLLESDHDTRWYERRKRSLVLGAMTRERYSCVFEPACGHGCLTAQLARRSHALLAMDLDLHALASARLALADAPNARVCQGQAPEDWPLDRAFDLIVLSEFLYYVSSERLRAICDAALQTLQDNGEIIACHWRHSIPESSRSAEGIHARCARWLGLLCHTEIADADFILHAWVREPRSVAVREGLAP